MKIYHPEHGDRTIPSIDFTDAWRRQGWQAAPLKTSPPAPAPRLIELPPSEPALFDPVKARIAELEQLERDKGWDAIKDIAESFDPPVPKAETWAKTIPDIVKREQELGRL